VIRFHPSLAWRERDAVIRVQAMIAAMRNIESDEIVAVSCRRLTPDGHKVGKPKFRGAAAGSAIKLDADETVTHGVHIGEGVESCMSARQLGLKPTWALGSTCNIAAFPVLSGIDCLTILGANNDASAKAIQACGET
jgi:putative DNA primase/helicase